ncbi:antA/AntB antirepressor family protein [Mesorhizobium sp. M0058]|uniref:antA/AntB antirepressor family protein n=1 Tax=Mesorhizobium sp. M0058 TaxID=2956865 RepID=UPI0033394387
MSDQFPAISTGSIGAAAVQTVNARDLHAFLKSGKDFSNWIKDRIDQYGFAENVDFVVFAWMGDNPKGGRPAKEYALSIDMAKELSMVERNEQGKRARQYFIECERRAKDPMSALNDPAAMRGLLLTYTEKVIALESRVAELIPSHDALQRIAAADGSLCITDAAKALQMQPKEFFARLLRNGWIFKRRGSSNYLGYESKVSAGYIEHKVTAVPRGDGSEKIVEQVRITPKGLTKIASLISRH